MPLSLAFGVRWSGDPRRGRVRFLGAAGGQLWNGRRGKCGIGDGGEVFLVAGVLFPLSMATSKVKSMLRCARGPHPPFGHLLPQAGEGLLSPLTMPSGSALLLRSGRRWRGAPDEGASGASCFCRGRGFRRSYVGGSGCLSGSRASMASARISPVTEIGRAHVLTPVTNAHLVCRLLLEKKKQIENTTESVLVTTKKD